MGTLTSNLHLMMNTFYKPTPIRYKILCETKAFPSDQVRSRHRSILLYHVFTNFPSFNLCCYIALSEPQYAFASQAALHGLDPHDAVFELSPRPGEYTLREEDIIAAIEREGQTIAMVLFPAVQYYSGQWFPMERITRSAKAQVRSRSSEIYISEQGLWMMKSTVYPPSFAVSLNF